MPLRDAELCARAIDSALRDNSDGSDPLSRYRLRRDRLSTELLLQSYRLGSYEWDLGEASALMRGITNAVKDECEAMSLLPAWHAIPTRLAPVG
jgi:hypothetical protein